MAYYRARVRKKQRQANCPGFTSEFVEEATAKYMKGGGEIIFVDKFETSENLKAATLDKKHADDFLRS